MGVGVVMAGVGGWLLSLHGDIACESGTRITCPEIYDTKYPAGVLLGLGAASIGAGILSLWLNNHWPQSTLKRSTPNAKPANSTSKKNVFMPSVAPTQGGAAASFSITF